MKFLIITLYVILLNSLQGQTFEIKYSTDADDVVFDATFTDSIHATFILSSGTYASGSYSSKLFKLNIENSMFADSVEVKQTNEEYTYEWISKILITGANELTTIGRCRNNNTNDIQIFISRFTTDLEPIGDTIVGDPNLNENFFDVIFSSDSLLVFTGMRSPGLVWLEERNVKGEFIRNMIYTEQGYLGSTIIEIESLNKYHLYGYWDGDNPYYILNKSDLSVDTIMFYHDRFLPRNAVGSHLDDFYYVGGRHLTIPVHQDNLFYMKVNKFGEIIQETELFTDSIAYFTQNCIVTAYSDIYIAGAYPCTWQAPPLEFYPEHRWILMYKLSEAGEVLWQQFYKGEHNYMPFKILATYDGGCLIFSSFYDWNDPIPNQRDVHILKIDSTGYYSPITGTEEVVEQPRQVLVYPNPVKDKLHFVFGLYSDLTISIYDASGREMISEMYHRSPTLDLSGFRKGLYLYRITGAKGLIEKGKIIKE